MIETLGIIEKIGCVVPIFYQVCQNNTQVFRIWKITI